MAKKKKEKKSKFQIITIVMAIIMAIITLGGVILPIVMKMVNQ